MIKNNSMAANYISESGIFCLLR